MFVFKKYTINEIFLLDLHSAFQLPAKVNFFLIG